MASMAANRVASPISASISRFTRVRASQVTAQQASTASRRLRPFSLSSSRPQQPIAKPAPTHSSTRTAQSTTTPSPTAAEKPPTTARTEASNPRQPAIQDLSRSGLSDGRSSPAADASEKGVDWTSSFSGLSAEAFSSEVAQILLAPLATDDVEVKPDGIVYLPEIKYRRILNRAFGPGGWGLAPRGETIVTSKTVTREYALVAHGRLISIARGEQQYFEPDGIPTATEGCKSNALMRCCKDLGVASELWDPRWIRKFMREHAKDVWVEHVVTKKKRKITVRKDDEVRYPYAPSKVGA